ncbi:hypothetical protein [Sphingosinithalassobacter sp. CS137]|uniref:hypothetical protein n=1 Tax=Sphingosinithalassobacter sp. CS137 TaxID=2762748 RepID=UPI00165D70C3|nr:hypothetical protein [Sphingosinithalassobacter sp. CS137]
MQWQVDVASAFRSMRVPETTADRRATWIAWAFGLFLLIVQSLPALRSGLTEGFQYNALAVAMHLHAGTPALTDQIYPLNQEFFLLSRLGSNWLLSLFVPLNAIDPLLPTRGIAVGSLILMVASLLLFTRRVTGLEWSWTILLTALLQSVFFSAYLATDSLTSAAVVCAAAATLAYGTRWWQILVAGMLLGVAIILRLESLLAAPFFALWLLLQPGDWRSRGTKLAAAGVLAAAIPNIFLLANGTSIFEALAISGKAIAMWARPLAPLNKITVLMIFAQPAFVLLAMVGTIRLAIARQHAILLMLLGPILLFVAFSFGNLYNSRQLLAITPPAMLLAVWGLQHLRSAVSLAGHRWQKAVASLVGIFLVATFAYPLGRTEEGPRPFVGQVPTALWWWQYLGQLETSNRNALHSIAAYVAAHPNGVIFSHDWNGDRLALWSLALAGYSPLSRQGSQACERYAEAFGHDGDIVHHFRATLPFLGEKAAGRLAAEQLFPCLREWGGSDLPVLLVTTRPMSQLSGMAGRMVAGAPTQERAAPFIDIRLRGSRPEIGSDAGYLVKSFLLPPTRAALETVPPGASNGRAGDAVAEAELREPTGRAAR